MISKNSVLLQQMNLAAEMERSINEKPAFLAHKMSKPVISMETRSQILLMSVQISQKITMESKIAMAVLSHLLNAKETTVPS